MTVDAFGDVGKGEMMGAEREPTGGVTWRRMEVRRKEDEPQGKREGIGLDALFFDRYKGTGEGAPPVGFCEKHPRY